MNQKTLAIIALVLDAVIWGLTLPIMKYALGEIPPFSLALGRFSIASLLALIFFGFKDLKLKDFAQIGIFTLFGINLSIGLLLLGLDHTQAIDATLILSLSPIITAYLAHTLIREKISTIHKIGLVLGVVGVSFYLLVPSLTGQTTKLSLLGDLLILISNIAAAIYTIGSKKLFTIYNAKQISAVSFLIGALGFLPGSIIESTRHPGWLNHVSTGSVISILFLGIVSSFLAYSLYIWGLSKVKVYITANLSNLSPLISILAAAVFLKETLTIYFFFSFALVLIGVYLTTINTPEGHPHHHHLHRRV